MLFLCLDCGIVSNKYYPVTDECTECKVGRIRKIKRIHIYDYVDPWSKIAYRYSDKGCPVCGGRVVVEDGYLVCVAEGTCTYSAEIKTMEVV